MADDAVSKARLIMAATVPDQTYAMVPRTLLAELADLVESLREREESVAMTARAGGQEYVVRDCAGRGCMYCGELLKTTFKAVTP